MTTSADWTGRWLAERLPTHEEVASVHVPYPQIIEIARKKHTTITVGTTAVERLDAGSIDPILSVGVPLSFLINIPKESYVTGAALDLARQHGIQIGNVGDLFRALSIPDVSEYQNPEIGFVERGLAQHTRVTRYRRLDDRRYLIHRRGLDDVICVFLNEYELIADHVRTAHSRYGSCRMLVMTNPNCRPTSAAEHVAAELGCTILKWGPFLGALNRP